MHKRHRLIFWQEILISDFQIRHLPYGIKNITQATIGPVPSRILVIPGFGRKKNSGEDIKLMDE
jgi:hypothetical protein